MCILLNYGAVFITNALVIKANPTVELKEANDIQAEMNNYEKHEQGDALMMALFIQCILWTILISVYISNRMFLISYQQITIMTFVIVYFAFIIALDFVNDFGYLIGKILWGI